MPSATIMSRNRLALEAAADTSAAMTASSFFSRMRPLWVSAPTLRGPPDAALVPSMNAAAAFLYKTVGRPRVFMAAQARGHAAHGPRPGGSIFYLTACMGA